MPKEAKTAIDWTQLTKDLSMPFEEHEIKYRAGAVSRDKKRAQALPYADPRVYEDRLNALVPGAWEVEFEPWGDSRIICRLSIHGVTRSSTGESGDGPDAVAGTAAEAQAFKRACAKFGLGRYLYAMEAQWVDYDAEKRRIPQPSAPAVTQRTPRLREQVANDSIGPERAVRLGKALADLGIEPRRQAGYASQILGITVRKLDSLVEEDAARIWKTAKRDAANRQKTAA